MFLDKIALILAIIGGLNWGSIGIFRFDIVAALFYLVVTLPLARVVGMLETRLSGGGRDDKASAAMTPQAHESGM